MLKLQKKRINNNEAEECKNNWNTPKYFSKKCTERKKNNGKESNQFDGSINTPVRGNFFLRYFFCFCFI